MTHTAVLLLQMGGPNSLDEVEPYLRRLFLDPDLVRLPFPVSLFRRPLAARIARRRAPSVRAQYAAIGGASPNNAITTAQAHRLQTALSLPCHPFLTYSDTSCRVTSSRFLDTRCRGSGVRVEQIVALSMFPHYCTATTRASFRELDRVLEAARAAGHPFEGKLLRIERWGDHPAYLDALAARTRAALEEARAAHPAPPRLLISAHGIPESYRRSGDPYVQEIEASVAGLRARLPEDLPIQLSFQSRATPVRWVGPSSLESVARLGAEGARNLVVLPISFVSDHVETLYEIDVQLAAAAHTAGIEAFHRVPSFNADPDLIEILRGLVSEALSK